MFRATLYLVVVLLSSCIIIPAPKPDPYLASLLEQLVVDQTSKSDVVELLGEPSIQREGDNIWIYGESNREFFAVGYQIAESVHDYQVLILHFDNNTLRAWEKLDERLNKWDCSQSGICISHGWRKTDEGPEKLISEASIASVRDDDKEAKRFSVQKDICQLYVYNSSFPPAWLVHDSNLRGRFIRVFIGKIESPLIGREAYMHTTLGRGNHQLVVFLPSQYHNQNHPSIAAYEEESFPVEFNCQGGELIFLAVVAVNSAKIEGQWRRTIETEFQSKNAGIEEVGKRKLLLLH